MLIKCPECNREISDQAISCPHCGYPLKSIRKSEQKRDGLISLAQRGGARGFHVFFFIFSSLVALAGGGLLFVAAFIIANTSLITGGIVLVVLGNTLIAVGVVGIIYLIILLIMNAQVKNDMIYFDSSSEEFVFYSIRNKEIRLKRNASFFIRNNMRNAGELILKEPGKRKVILGFPIEGEELLRSKIDKYR